jgi:hypothetical protein
MIRSTSPQRHGHSFFTSQISDQFATLDDIATCIHFCSDYRLVLMKLTSRTGALIHDMSPSLYSLPPFPIGALRALSRPILHSKLLETLSPSFLRSSQDANAKVLPTAWLDGMRGLAAFFVYIRHFGAIHHPDIQPGFGSSPENRWFIQLPFIRLLISGPSMVALFFIISGYALSWGPLKVLHQGSQDQSMQRLSSATFRRAIRLYLPGIISTFFIMICISLGMYDWGQKTFESNIDMPGFHEPQPSQFRKDPFSVQFWDWVNSSWRWVNIWNVTNHQYNPHLWTLSVEFRCSIALFMVLLALSRTKTIYRLAGLGSFVLYCYYTNSWPEWLFFAGATLAQLKLIQVDRAADLGVKLEEDTESDDGTKKFPIAPADIGRIVLFTAGLYLLSAPDYGHGTNPEFSSCAV